MNRLNFTDLFFHSYFNLISSSAPQFGQLIETSLFPPSKSSVMCTSSEDAILSNVSNEGLVLPFTMLLILGCAIPISEASHTAVFPFSFNTSLILNPIVAYIVLDYTQR